VGIFVGWIIQKRWLTITASVLTFVGVFTLPSLPSPLNYTVLLPPVLLVMASIYEGGSLPGLTMSPRLRVALTLWMGLCVLVLMVGIVLSGSSSSRLIATFAVFLVLALAGVLPIGASHRRQRRQGPAERGREASDTDTTLV
jgi:hypothetical protein